MKEIPLTRGKVAIVDDEDYEELAKHKWHCSSWGYASRTHYPPGGGKVALRMHRVLLNPEKHLQVDHINGNKLDNRRCNLRICTNAENNRNKEKLPQNSSGFKGVSFNKKSGRFVAEIRFNWKLERIGSFDTAEEAHNAYCVRAKELFGEFFNDGKEVPHE